MAIKKFYYNIQVNPVTVNEEWTYVQPENQVSSDVVFSIDLLKIDHINDRIIGVSSPRDSSTKKVMRDA